MDESLAHHHRSGSAAAGSRRSKRRLTLILGMPNIRSMANASDPRTSSTATLLTLSCGGDR